MADLKQQLVKVDENQQINDINKQKKLLLTQTNWKWLFLFFACSMNSGMFYCLTIPGLLKQQYKDNLHTDEIGFSLLLSVPQFPSTLSPFITGVIIDNLGFRWGVFAFTFIMFGGQLVQAVAGINSICSYTLMMVGQFFTNFGQECGSMGLSSIISKWFVGDQLALGLSLLQTNLRIYEISAGWITQPLYDVNNSLFLPLFIGCIVCFMSWFIMGGGVIIMDRKLDQQLAIQDVQKEKKSTVRFSDIKKFNLLYWCVAVHCALGYFNYTSFNIQLPDILQKRFGISGLAKGRLASIPFWICFGTPFIGMMLDRVGKRSLFLIVTNCICVLSFVTFTLIPECHVDCSYLPVIPLVILGIYLAIYAATIWACVPVIIDKQYMGTAFGVVYCVKDIALSLGPIIMGGIVNAGATVVSGYFNLFFFMIGTSSLQLLLSIFMFFKDKQCGSNLYNYKKKDVVEQEQQKDDQKESNLSDEKL